MRVQVADDLSLPTEVADVEPGDFIGSKLGGFYSVGFVLRRGYQGKNAGRVSGFLIELASGGHNFIAEDDAVILGWGR